MAKGESSERAKMENLRVYLVDDHPLMRLALRRILESDPRFTVIGESDNAEEDLTTVTTYGCRYGSHGHSTARSGRS